MYIAPHQSLPKSHDIDSDPSELSQFPSDPRLSYSIDLVAVDSKWAPICLYGDVGWVPLKGILGFNMIIWARIIITVIVE